MNLSLDILMQHSTNHTLVYCLKWEKEKNFTFQLRVESIKKYCSLTKYLIAVEFLSEKEHLHLLCKVHHWTPTRDWKNSREPSELPATLN